MYSNEGQPYRKILTSTWTDQKFLQLSAHEKLVFLYLITCHHNHMTGIMVLSPAYAAIDLVNLSRDEIVDAMAALEGAGMIKWDRERGVVWVVNMAKHNASKGKASKPNRKHLLTLHGSPLVDEFRAMYPEYLSYAGDAPAPTAPHPAGPSGEPEDRPATPSPAASGVGFTFADGTAADDARVSDMAPGVVKRANQPESGAGLISYSPAPARGEVTDQGGAGPASPDQNRRQARDMIRRLSAATSADAKGRV
jgi:hypothetical protein